MPIYWPLIEQYLGTLPKTYQLKGDAKILLSFRFKTGMNQIQTAKHLGLKRNFIQMIEKGKKTLPHKTLFIINERQTWEKHS